MRDFVLQRLLAAGLVWASFCMGLPAQEASVPAPAPAATAPPAGTAVTRERSIYIPFEQLEKVFEEQERGVFLPYREFLEMWNKLNLPENLRPVEPPVTGVLSSAAYTGRAEGKMAVLQAHLSFEALKEGWSRLDLGAPELALTEVKSKGYLTAVEGGYAMVFPDKGSYTLDATVYGEITQEAGRHELKLSLPKTAVSQFELTIPEKGLEFTIDPGAAYSAKENPDGSTRLLVYFGGTESVTISWTRRASETALKPLLFSEVRTDVRLSPGAVRSNASITWRILRAGVDTFLVQVPSDQQVLTVEGENVREWSLEGGAQPAGTQMVKIVLHSPAKDGFSAHLKLERALGNLPQTVPFPVVQTPGTERQTGTIALYSDAELTTEVADLQGLSQQATGADPEGEHAVGEYRWLHLPFAGKIAVSEAKPQVEASSQTLVVVEPDRTEIRAEFSCTVKRAGIFSLEVELPPGYSHWEATGQGIESSGVQDAGGKQFLRLKLAERRTGVFAFVLTADAPRAKAESALTVPVFHPRVDRHEARVGIALQVSLKANTADKGDLREENVNGLISLTPPRPDTTPLTLGFRYRGEAKPAQIQFELRKPRVTAQVETLLSVRETLLRHDWTLRWNVEYAGVDEFAFSVPAEIADEMQIVGPDIRERSRTAPPAPGQPAGPVTWRVSTQGKVLGTYELHVSWESARAQSGESATSRAQLQELRVLNVSRETGQVAVTKDANIEIVKQEPRSLELIDPRELGPSLQQDGVILAWKYATHPIGLTLEVQKNQFLEVPTAIITYAVLGTVVSEDEAETTEVILWVKNNGQQFVAVQLPGGKAQARLLSDAFVDGQPQQPSRRPDRNELLIRLPATRGENRDFPVRFVYERPSLHPGQKLSFRGSLRLEPPQVAGVQILQSRWDLWLPRDYRYVGFRGAMHEALPERGWDGFRAALDLFVPQAGPMLPGPASTTQAEPPPLPPVKAAGFDTQLQREGTTIQLRRLGEPATMLVEYRSRTWAATLEALALLFSLGCGLLLTGTGRRVRLLYFLVVGCGALIIAGAKDPRTAGVWEALWLGVLIAALFWIAIGLLRWTGRLPGRLTSRLFRRPTPPTAA